MTKPPLLLNVLLASGFLTASIAADKPLRTDDYIYEPQIKTVLFYPAGEDAVAAPLQAPVLPLSQPVPLLLEFDELGDKTDYYRARIYHCNADWKQSNLSDMDVVDKFNDFILDQPRLSGSNARIHYTHYRLEVPRVKVSGNFLLMVYREGNVKDIIVTRRFVVYDSRAMIMPNITFPQGLEKKTNQQIEFTVDYGTMNIGNPWASLKIVVRQNYNWHNAITNLQPTAVREDQHRAEYRHFNLENNFPGGNEFRFFDLRSVRFLGQNVAKVNPGGDTVQVLLATNAPRTGESYSQVIDQNGRFVIDNYELNNGETEADYADVHFTLKAEALQEPVYIWGGLTNWTATAANQMRYDALGQVYRANLLLKQGYYNFRYAVGLPNGKLDETRLEGNHFETENTYEIIVYNRPPGARADMVIGYIAIPHNKRR